MGPDSIGFVYLAQSRRLTGWAARHGLGHPFKIGTTQDVRQRRLTLNEGFVKDGWRGPPCLGCTDWTMIAWWRHVSRRAANRVESEFKRLESCFVPLARDMLPWKQDARGAGEGDVFLLPHAAYAHLPPLAPQHAVIRSILIDNVRSALRRHYPAMTPPPPGGPPAPSEQEQHLEMLIDELWDARENAARASEEGWYYPDEV